MSIQFRNVYLPFSIPIHMDPAMREFCIMIKPNNMKLGKLPYRYEIVQHLLQVVYLQVNVLFLKEALFLHSLTLLEVLLKSYNKTTNLSFK